MALLHFCTALLKALKINLLCPKKKQKCKSPLENFHMVSSFHFCTALLTALKINLLCPSRSTKGCQTFFTWSGLLSLCLSQKIIQLFSKNGKKLGQIEFFDFSSHTVFQAVGIFNPLPATISFDFQISRHQDIYYWTLFYSC